ncbi:Hypothetical predicted protein [Scomber scombrus]|uniref:Uncharacterized protein n=1 Tax=Scomber scombrus TaxID=13677 RepID=A0AAV1PTH2_SCOSC
MKPPTSPDLHRPPRVTHLHNAWSSEACVQWKWLIWAPPTDTPAPSSPCLAGISHNLSAGRCFFQNGDEGATTTALFRDIIWNETEKHSTENHSRSSKMFL